MSKVLVTGANGFIGRYLVPRLRADGHEVVEVRRASGDVAEPATWRSLPATDVVVHLAAKSFVPDSWNAPLEFLRTNLVGTVGAIEHCKAHRARLVFPSSYLYGEAPRQPIPETAATVATNPYALSKKLAEEACEFFGGRLGIPITILRPFNIFGPGQADTFLVPTIVSQIKAGKEISVRDLEPRRDYVYVLDVVDAMARAVLVERGFNVLNVGSGMSHSVADLIQAMQEVWGTSLPVRSSGDRRKNELMDTVADITRAGQVLGWSPRFTLRQGLEHLRASQ